MEMSLDLPKVVVKVDKMVGGRAMSKADKTYEQMVETMVLMKSEETVDE
jgi:hypothetical protein